MSLLIKSASNATLSPRAAGRFRACRNEHLGGGVEMKTRDGWMRRGLLLVVGGLSVGALVVACGSSKTSTGGGSSGTGGGAGAGASGGSGTGGSTAGVGTKICGQTAADACDVCMFTNCCTQFQACTSNAACLALLTCASNCPSSSTTCATDCVNANPSGLAPVMTINTCMTNSCAVECK
jgi:hypothetical protein